MELYNLGLVSKDKDRFKHIEVVRKYYKADVQPEQIPIQVI